MPIALRCTAPDCGHVSLVPANLITVGPAGHTVTTGEGHHVVIWTCPQCLYRCCLMQSGAFGAGLLIDGAQALTPQLLDLTVDFDGVTTSVTRTVNGHGETVTIVQRFDTEERVASHIFGDHAEALRWVAQQQHPAGGAT